MEIKLINLVLSRKAGGEILCGRSSKEKITIGRNYDCDIVIPADYSDVSKKHCTIYQMGGEVTIEDHSSHGTYVNGESVDEEECVLNNRDKLRLAGICKLEIRIGEEELKLHSEPDDSAPEVRIED